METKDKRMEEYIPSGGVEVKAPMGKRRLWIVFCFVLLIMSLMLFDYIWGESKYSTGGVGGLFLMCVTYISFQFLLLYFFTGRDIRALRFRIHWGITGVLLKKPMLLKYYRVMLVLPATVLGVLPSIHGLCTGNPTCYAVGLVLFYAGAMGDFVYLWKLRHFSGEDMIVDGEEPYSAIVFKGTYINSDKM